VRFGRREARRYSPHFNEQFYLSTYPDVAAAVASGALRSGLEHFASYGQFEGRRGSQA
jgi:hypothetical protein